MKYGEGSTGRVFILRLEHGDIIPEIIEDFASLKKIDAGLSFFIGGADKKSKIISGHEDGVAKKPVPVINSLNNVHESACISTISLNKNCSLLKECLDNFSYQQEN